MEATRRTSYFSRKQNQGNNWVFVCFSHLEENLLSSFLSCRQTQSHSVPAQIPSGTSCCYENLAHILKFCILNDTTFVDNLHNPLKCFGSSLGTYNSGYQENTMQMVVALYDLGNHGKKYAIFSTNAIPSLSNFTPKHLDAAGAALQLPAAAMFGLKPHTGHRK